VLTRIIDCQIIKFERDASGEVDVNINRNFPYHILNEKEANRRKRILHKMRIIQYPKITRVWAVAHVKKSLLALSTLRKPQLST